jgi:hypothetical protein
MLSYFEVQCSFQQPDSDGPNENNSDHKWSSDERARVSEDDSDHSEERKKNHSEELRRNLKNRGVAVRKE